MKGRNGLLPSLLLPSVAFAFAFGCGARRERRPSRYQVWSELAERNCLLASFSVAVAVVSRPRHHHNRNKKARRSIESPGSLT